MVHSRPGREIVWIGSTWPRKSATAGTAKRAHGALIWKTFCCTWSNGKSSQNGEVVGGYPPSQPPCFFAEIIGVADIEAQVAILAMAVVPGSGEDGGGLAVRKRIKEHGPCEAENSRRGTNAERHGAGGDEMKAGAFAEKAENKSAVFREFRNNWHRQLRLQRQQVWRQEHDRDRGPCQVAAEACTITPCPGQHAWSGGSFPARHQS